MASAPRKNDYHHKWLEELPPQPIPDNPDVLELALKFCEWRNVYTSTFLHNYNLNAKTFGLLIWKYVYENLKDEIPYEPIIGSEVFTNMYYKPYPNDNIPKDVFLCQLATQEVLEDIYIKLMEMTELDETNKYVKFARFFIKHADLRLRGF